MTSQTLSETIDHLSGLQKGVLTLLSASETWQLHLDSGRLIYPVSEHHRVRRWDRAIRQQRPHWNWGTAAAWQSGQSFWELQLLEAGFAQNQLSPLQAKLAIRSAAQECFFDLNRSNDLKVEWEPVTTSLSHSCQTAILSTREIQMLHHKAVNMQQEWQEAGLGDFSPNLAPILTQEIASEKLPVPRSYFGGHFNVWDISLELGLSLTKLARSLVPLALNSVLRFDQIQDLSAPTATDSQPSADAHTAQAPKAAQRPLLVACIDDSPVLAHTLRKILTSVGHQMMSIQEPMRGFSLLIEHRPDLILLDLNLPNADGYSICKFLRDTPVFEKTPIIILTGQDSHIDRLKAQLAGATAFLAKPPRAHELLATIQEYSV
ncbi:MAG: response regulator [Leptolyngbya sp. SIO4C1]|nr:response regulator [Leptolyngbya sp. SIO4C1]